MSPKVWSFPICCKERGENATEAKREHWENLRDPGSFVLGIYSLEAAEEMLRRTAYSTW